MMLLLPKRPYQKFTFTKKLQATRNELWCTVKQCVEASMITFVVKLQVSRSDYDCFLEPSECCTSNGNYTKLE